MKTKEMNKLIVHFDKLYKQSDCQVPHPLNMASHIDIQLAQEHYPADH